MSTGAETAVLSKSQSLALRIVSKGIEKAAAEAVKAHGQEFLKHVLPALLATSLGGPLAAGAGAIVAAIAESIFKETSATERKLDSLLAEPLKTATRTINDVLSEEVQSDAEEVEANRRLRAAADRLEKAYTYAQAESPDELFIIRLYQSLVAALTEGGGASMRRYLGEFQSIIIGARKEAERLRGEASRVRNKDSEYVIEALKEHREFNLTLDLANIGGRPLPYMPPSEAYIKNRLDEYEARLKERAAVIEKQGCDIERFGSLLQAVYGNRREILRVAKSRNVLRKLWETVRPGGAQN